MSFKLQNNQKRTQFTRCFYYKNLHKIPFTIESIIVFYTLTKEISLKPLIKISALLELICNQRSVFLRSKKLSVASKIRKGTPVGSLVSLRKGSLKKFLFSLIWEILPNVKNTVFNLNKKKSKMFALRNSVFFKIVDPLVFPKLRKFYTIFKNCINTRCVFSFAKKSTQAEIILNKRYSLLPL